MLDPKPTILVVDDETMVLKMLGHLLRREGYEVRESSSARKVLDMESDCLRCARLLITDVQMPGMDGIVLARNLVAIYPDLRILFMSGFVGGKPVPKSLGDQETFFIEKPFSPERLLGIVEDLCIRPINRPS